MSVKGYYIVCDGCGKQERIPYVGTLPDLTYVDKELLEELQWKDYCPECAEDKG